MALPIAPTPVLRGKEAADFVRWIHANENKKVGLVPTPKLEQAIKLLRENASIKK
jgi:hypothetical protein